MADIGRQLDCGSRNSIVCFTGNVESVKNSPRCLADDGVKTADDSGVMKEIVQVWVLD